MQRCFRSVAALALTLLLLLGACAQGRDWLERGFIVTVDEAVPVSCLAGYGRSDGALPLGCANEFNLTRMVENQRDLVTPRRLGPAFAAPVAAAAEDYLGLLEEAPPTGVVGERRPSVERIEIEQGGPE